MEKAARETLAEIDPSLGRGARLPLAAVLLGVVLLVALAPLALFRLLTTAEMKESLVTAQQEHQLHLATTVATQIDAFLDQVGRSASKIGEAVGTLTANADADAPPFLGSFLDDTIVLARYIPSGGTASASRRQDFVLPPALDDVLRKDANALLAAGMGQLAPSNRSAILSGPFAIGPERLLVVAVSSPVQRHGRFVGAYQEVALLQRVWDEAAGAIPAPTRLYLLRADGSLAASSPADGLVADPRSFKEREIVQLFLRSRGRSRGARAFDVTTSSGQTRRVLGSYAATSHSWGVFIEVDEHLALAPVERLGRLMSYGGALAAALAVAAALFLGAMISRPITRLAQVSKRLADGDFSVQAKSSRMFELDTLALNFDRMARRLGDLVERFRAAAREANDMFLGVIRSLAEAIDEKDPYTKGHSVRVNRYAVIIGRYLGLSREEMRHLQISSLLHDIGKIGIDDAILKKPAALVPEEFAVMKTHPERGAKIMARIPQLRNIIPGMRFHHERYSGGGYPMGLKGEEIPLQARIIAVADTFDAMTTERPYQRAFTVRAAVARINDLKGKHLDPQVVEAFNRAYEAGEFDDLFPQQAAGSNLEGESRAVAGTGPASGLGSAVPAPAFRRATDSVTTGPQSKA